MKRIRSTQRRKERWGRDENRKKRDRPGTSKP
jgi:hypothetical protein